MSSVTELLTVVMDAKIVLQTCKRLFTCVIHCRPNEYNKHVTAKNQETANKIELNIYYYSVSLTYLSDRLRLVYRVGGMGV